MHSSTRRRLASVAAMLLCAFGFAGAASADDSVLFSQTAVSPNVLLIMDNSVSMNTIIYHPAFDQTATYSCNPSAGYGTFPTQPGGAFDPSLEYFVEGTKFMYVSGGTLVTINNAFPMTKCGKARTLMSDANASPDPVYGNKLTRYSGAYLNWLFSPESDPYWTAISSQTNGIPSSCVGGAAFSRYGRTRMNVAKQVLKDVVCQVNLVGAVRFGIAVFRSNGTNDPNGGYILEPVDIPSSNQQSDLVSAINSIDADSFTPLGETLFQAYTYFMSRDSTQLPVGQNGVTKFPKYEYNTSTTGVGGTWTSNSTLIPPDPVQYDCQKHFVIIVTDGDPSMDDFDVETPVSTALGFNNFVNLIGDYNADGEVETPAGSNDPALYLDDIAKYMHEKDFRPDMADDQTIDVYTIAYAATPVAEALLQKTAQVANGLYFKSDDPDQLSAAIIDSLQDIVEKSQSFTAATVPASRTVAGEQIYVSLFTPSSRSPYWNGVLRSYRLTAAGEILAVNGTCAVDDPTAPCNTGPFLPTATHPPYWDAADEMPLPGARNLFVSKLNLLGNPTVADFEHLSTGGSLLATDLGVTYPPAAPYAGSIATDAESLTAEIISNVRGCYFGTGANGVPCETRISVLSDIFHSNPVVVGRPGFVSSDPSYLAFRTTNLTRDRVLYAGSNGGFLHGFHAGDWQAAASPPAYNAGTGEELFGFMPWPSRKTIRHLPQDLSGRDYYFVDGTPLAADAWLYTLPSQTVKLATGTEWRTVLAGGLRQGGGSYYALDITNPAATTCPAGEIGSGYPCLMWEFPRENDALATHATMGETWGEPIITKLKLSVSGNTVERWVAIASGGYHATGDPNAHSTYSSTATKGRSIWILDLKTGRPIAVRKYDTSGNCNNAITSQGNDETGMCYAIASTPAVYDSDSDGYADLIVVGDLGGNVWKWVVKNVGWDPVNTTKTLADNNAVWPFRKIFRAPAYGSNPYFYKSFYFPPQGFLKNGAAWYALGSGERNDLLYMSNSGTTADNNRFYVFKDVDLYETLATPQALVLETDLLDLTSSSICAGLGGYKGYFIVGEEGEKWVTNSTMLSDYLFVGSYIPTASADPCELSGQSFLYRFKVECGEPLIDGTPAASVDPRAVDLGSGFPTDPRISVGPGGDADVIVTKQGGQIVTTPGGKLEDGGGYWREINN